MEKVGDVEHMLRLPPPLPESTRHFRIPDLPDEIGERKQDIFTKPVLEQLRCDIARVVLPSWLEKPPSNLGDASHGKLKADQWRVLCTVHMVITLVRLWGHSGATDEERQVLQNFIHLIVAIDLASRRSMSADRAALYDHHMYAYMQGLREIFDHHLVPNHHLALHLSRCLELFGPVHGWWAYPFERYNGLLQRLNTNHKPREHIFTCFSHRLFIRSTHPIIGEMPMTFMRSFYAGSRLRHIMNTADWPELPIYQQWLDSFKRTFSELTRGTRVTDALSFEFVNATRPPSTTHDYAEDSQTTLPSIIYDSLLSVITSRGSVFASAYGTRITRQLATLPTQAQFVKSVLHDGVTFTDSGRNSFVTYRIRTGQVESQGAGRIDKIFYHRRKEGQTIVVEPFVVIHEYRCLSKEHEQLDPYRALDGLNTKLYYNSFDATPRLLPLNDIIAHFASLVYTPQDIGQKCIVVLSLDRVSLISIHASKLINRACPQS